MKKDNNEEEKVAVFHLKITLSQTKLMLSFNTTNQLKTKALATKSIQMLNYASSSKHGLVL